MANTDQVIVEGEVFTEKRHIEFVRDMEDAGIEVRTYSGRFMYGKQCPAVACDGNREVSTQDVMGATKVKLSRDSLGLGTILYVP